MKFIKYILTVMFKKLDDKQIRRPENIGTHTITCVQIVWNFFTDLNYFWLSKY